MATGSAPIDPVAPRSRPGSEAEHFLLLAEEAFQSRRPVDTVRLAKKSLTAGGGTRARLVLAKAYLDMELFEEAKTQYQTVLAREPHNAIARMGIDVVQRQLSHGPPQ